MQLRETLREGERGGEKIQDDLRIIQKSEHFFGWK